jgi:hypothetical protein
VSDADSVTVDQEHEDALDTRAPFTRAAGLKAGLSDRQLRSARFTRILDGVYVDGAVPISEAVMVQALHLIAPADAFVSHASAARWFGCPLPPLPEEHITVPSRAARFRRFGVRCHVARGGETFQKAAVGNVATAAQTFVDLASQLTLVDLVIVGDWLVRKKRIGLEALRAYCAASTSAHARAARLAAAYVRPGVDSPMETRLRMLIVLAGLPEPVVNLTIRDVNGEPVRKYDLSWPSIRLIVEYDGKHHVERIEQWEKDLARREAIEDDDWRILVVTSTGIFDVPEETVTRIHTQLRRRRMPGTPQRPTQQWRAHFPGKAAL